MRPIKAQVPLPDLNLAAPADKHPSEYPYLKFAKMLDSLVDLPKAQGGQIDATKIALTKKNCDELYAHVRAWVKMNTPKIYTKAGKQKFLEKQAGMALLDHGPVELKVEDGYSDDKAYVLFE